MIQLKLVKVSSPQDTAKSKLCEHASGSFNHSSIQQGWVGAIQIPKFIGFLFSVLVHPRIQCMKPFNYS
jgi:hypothetical protein